jgi:hypothetical protein
MRRLFWVALGATAGVLVVRQAKKTAAQLTPQNVAGSVIDSARAFWAEVMEGMSERELELREAFGFTSDVASK